MDTKALYVTAVIIASISGGYYYYSGKGKKLDAASAQSMTYSAKGIHVLQTDDKGQLHVRATVDDIVQDMKLNTSELHNVNASMYSNNVVDSTFFARKGNGYNENEKIVLTGDVKATKISAQGEMVFHTDVLTGYPKLKTFETQKQVIVDSPSGQFVSQGMKSNWQQGQYEFFKIRGKYAPH